MLKSEVARSSWGAAFIKALEIFEPEPQRLFNDLLIPQLMPYGYRMLLKSMKVKPIRKWMLQKIEIKGRGVRGALLSRTRYIDDVLRDSMNHEISQVVLLGTGMDTRPYRYPSNKDIVFYEVDYPDVLTFKKKRLTRILKSLPPSVCYVPLDFQLESLEQGLADTDFTLDKKTLYIWEGVTQYISRDAANHVMQYVSGSKKGSQLVFTYIEKRFIDQMETATEFNPKFQKTLKRIWINGYDPVKLPQYLSSYGFFLHEDVGKEEFLDRYLNSLHRSMDLLNMERILLAEKV